MVNCGAGNDTFSGLKICHFLEVYFWVDCGKAEATTKAKAMNLSLRPSGFAPAFGRAVARFARAFFCGAKGPRLIRLR
jgi:hypothetical protein